MYKKNKFFAIAGLYVLFVGIQVYACIITYAARQSELPHNFGNFERIRTSLPASDPEAPFTFVVVGDTRSQGTFEGLAKEINESDPAFVVILGDWVNGGSIDQHAYFKREASEYNFVCPVFFTPGNHDVDPEKYPLASFEKEYGPRNFSFVYNDNIFISISHLDGRFSNNESLEYLRSLDPGALSAYRNRFVFMHIPPWVSPDIKERHTADEKDFMQIFEELKIDYVVAADFHGYNRTRLGGVEYIITGGGGSHLHESQGRQFYHAVSLTVGPGMVSERILPALANFDFEDWFEMNSIVYVGPFLIDNIYLFIIFNIFLITSFLFLKKLKV